MTTYHTVTLTTEQCNLILEAISTGAYVVEAVEPIEREIDSALLRHEMDTDTSDETGPLGNQCWEGPESEFPDTCIWMMEDTDEDGPTVRECGRTVAYGERRPYCPWHASALDLPDNEFEARVEAGETWSR